MVDLVNIAGHAAYRESTAADLESIRTLEAIVGSGTGQCEALILAPVDTISLVAEIDGGIVGHVLLTAITGPERALALAPLAVLPAWRDMQIGTELVRNGLQLARQRGWRSVFVSGQPDYYCRFGFRSHTADGAQTPLQGPRFLALELEKGALAGWTGQLAYPEAFLESSDSSSNA